MSTFWTSADGAATLHLGDCRDVLAALPAEHFDSCVTDPPYGMREYPESMIRKLLDAWLHEGDYQAGGSGFMNRKWDAVVPGPSAFRAIYRSLKPGAHLVAFASAGTQDLMTLSVRLAGFEIRHVIDWMYSDGMPKYKDIGKAIDEDAFIRWISDCRPELARMAPKRRRSNLHKVWASAPKDRWAWRWCQIAEAKYGPLVGKRPIVSEIEQRGPKFPQAADMVANGGFNDPDRNSYAVTAPATDEAEEWDGWHTAVKPAREPIIIARKPVRRGYTVQRQVLETGTGAFNIDACRVGSRVQTITRGGNRDRSVYGGFAHDTAAAPTTFTYTKGRWPADVILCHQEGCEMTGSRRVRANGDVSGNETSRTAIFGQAGRPAFQAHGDGDGFETIEDWRCAPGCVIAELNRQSGVSKSSDRPRFTSAESQNSQVSMKDGHRARVSAGYEDEGGASRFFQQIHPWPEYPFRLVPKPSRGEKDKGLNHLQAKTGGGATGRRDGSAGLGPRAGAGRTGGARNTHPTVKPVALMEYLIRLVTPPGGSVLDPFCGSATTGVAAIRDGFTFTGIDLTAEHLPIAQGRLQDACKVNPLNLPLFAGLQVVGNEEATA